MLEGYGGYRRRHEFCREPIEQLRMRRRLPIASKIRGRWHNPTTEMPQPDVVHRHARGQRVVTAGKPMRKSKPPPAARRRIDFRRTRLVKDGGSGLKFLFGFDKGLLCVSGFLFRGFQLFRSIFRNILFSFEFGGGFFSVSLGHRLLFGNLDSFRGVIRF